MRPCLRGIDHVAIGVRDLERSARWYRNVLNFTTFRPCDANFHEPRVIKMINHGAHIKLALLQLPDEVVAGSAKMMRRARLVEGVDESADFAAEDVRRILYDRCFRGHFAMAVETKDEFERIRRELQQGDILRKNLEHRMGLLDAASGHGSEGRGKNGDNAGSSGLGGGTGNAPGAVSSAFTSALEGSREHDPYLWTSYEDYGVQESIFFRDPDLNELEITFWNQKDGHECE